MKDCLSNIKNFTRHMIIIIYLTVLPDLLDTNICSSVVQKDTDEMNMIADLKRLH